MKKSYIKSVSTKHSKELREYSKLKTKLLILCENKSELSGAYNVECHHIDGREGQLLTDPFNIICITRNEHDMEHVKIKGNKHTKQELLDIVRAIRIEQGFKRIIRKVEK